MAKRHAHGAKLQYEDPATPGTYIDIGAVKDIGGPGGSTDVIDVTTHDSASGFREFLAGLKDPGELSFELAWDPEDAAGQKFLEDSWGDRSTQTWRIEMNTANNAYRQFDGFVSGFEPSNPVAEGEITASVTIKVTGAITVGTNP